MDALARRALSGGSEPLLTWYQPRTQTRIELSVRTVANWVDKTANLLAELGTSGPVAGLVSLTNPGHWMSLVWPLATWQHGSCYQVVDEPGSEADLVVVGPEDPQRRPHQVIACSLQMTGLSGLPSGVLDFTTEALAQPDTHRVAPVDPHAAAWVGQSRKVSHAETGLLAPQDSRVLVVATDAWQTLRDGVLRPLLGRGSAVIVDPPAAADELTAITAGEGAKRS